MCSGEGVRVRIRRETSDFCPGLEMLILIRVVVLKMVKSSSLGVCLADRTDESN